MRLHHEPTRVLRPRVLIYGGLLGALVVGFVVAIALRSPVSLDVLRDRNALYRLTDDGNVDNVYTLRILNKTEREQRFRIEAQRRVGADADSGGSRVPRGQWRRCIRCRCACGAPPTIRSGPRPSR